MQILSDSVMEQLSTSSGTVGLRHPSPAGRSAVDRDSRVGSRELGVGCQDLMGWMYGGELQVVTEVSEANPVGQIGRTGRTGQNREAQEHKPWETPRRWIEGSTESGWSPRPTWNKPPHDQDGSGMLKLQYLSYPPVYLTPYTALPSQAVQTI